MLLEVKETTVPAPTLRVYDNNAREQN